jgi:isopenicillin N synthase-like dioxygenase
MHPIPIINIEGLIAMESEQELIEIANQVKVACIEHGFFYIKGHGISKALQSQLKTQSKLFFDLPLAEKMRISMDKGGKAWRGFFPLGQELTSGLPDMKEGLYFGSELNENHPAVQNNLPLHGKNLFPEDPQNFKKIVLEYLFQVEKLGHLLMRVFSVSLCKPEYYFHKYFTKDPLLLFRIFHYPAVSQPNHWGVGEHTDYGLLTILLQDDIGGLQVKSRGIWIDAPPIENTFICNIGDMLELITNGLFTSTPHRVKNNSCKSRYSFPLFFDPNMQSQIFKIPDITSSFKENKRWDGADISQYSGTYGTYLLQKLTKVFPDLSDKVK